jgi:hypothetical protein
LTRVCFQERGERLKARRESVIAESVLAAFLVEVLVEFEDEVVGAAVGVLDSEKSSRAVGERHGVGPVGRGEEDHLRGGTGAADGCDDGLGGSGPGVHVEVGLAFAIVRLVHDAEDDTGLGAPVRGDLGPRCGEFVCAGAVLANNGASPAAVVMNIDTGRKSESVPLLRTTLATIPPVECINAVSANPDQNDLHAVSLSTGIKTNLYQSIVGAEIGRV